MCSRGDIRSVACACLRKIKIYQGKHIQKDCLKARDNLQIYLILPVQTQQKTPANLSFLASELVLVIVQSLICVRFFVTPRTAAYQALLSFNVSWSLLKLMSIESVMPSSHRILCCPLLLLPSVFPASGSFLMSQLFTSGGQSIRKRYNTQRLFCSGRREPLGRRPKSRPSTCRGRAD